MTKERAEEVMEALALYEVDSSNNPAPSNIEIGTSIRVLGMLEASDLFRSTIDNIEISDDEDEE